MATTNHTPQDSVGNQPAYLSTLLQSMQEAEGMARDALAAGHMQSHMAAGRAYHAIAGVLLDLTGTEYRPTN